ncbi:MAG: hypothetical protein J7455_17490 [Roseiflexus sp.]|jgi:hypothetical protein|nr:hypothetical protein [Roseiflexus sp.]MBO9341912.1 hypothetical protein [Roseiflexus sp.]MBO9366421.1 hypothetical protein [Roseiflexus sp.]MBO9384312.1 hypothetical protein [Roseiflexus sp.]MBO9390927.1 hypothetical protein [Roseiflexus sp.]
MFAHLLALMRMGSHIARSTRCVRCRRMIMVLLVALVLASIAAPAQKSTAAPSALQIANIQTNASNVGLYEKFELTFTINGTVATNPFFPYDPSPPAGVPVGVGISVEGLFSPDNWKTVITQPGFIYQGYERQCIGGDPDNGCLGGAEWLYPQGDAVWKVRFAPQRTGVWRYRVRATDASGTVQSSEGTFTVTTSNVPHNHGFIRVSPTDPGYFEYSDGTPFIGVGYNESFDGKRFTYAVDASMRRLAAGRVNFLRMWMTGSSIFMAPWNPWHSHHLPGEGGYFNPASLTYAQAYPGHLVSLRLWDYPDPSMENRRNPCMFQGFTNNVSVKPNTTYQLSIRARTIGVIGPRNQDFPDYGLTVRKAGWLGDTCADPAATSSASTRLAGYVNGTTDGWKTFTSTFTTGANEFFLGNLYLILENTTSGQAFVDEISIREVAGGVPVGPEVLRKNRFAYHLYFDQQPSWQWDHLFAEAERYGVTIRPVVLEKNDWIANHIDANGNPTGGYYDLDNNRFYAAPNTAVRRFHEYFWRYLIARWGYSRAVHSWELINEGDPYNGNHYAQANAFGEFMHTHDAHPHLVTTSNWHSFPIAEFWGNPAYRHVDYADIHAYACCGALAAGWAQNIRSPLSFENRPAYVAGSRGHSVRIPGNTRFNNAGGTPRSLVISGRGEWVIRYQMKAERFTGRCEYGISDTLAGPRLLWILDNTRSNVVPPAPSGQNFVCSAPAGTYDWRTFDSRTTADGQSAPRTARLIIDDNNLHELAIFFQNGFGTDGNAWIDNVELIGPDGRRVYLNGEFDLTRIDHDTAQLTASYSLGIGGRTPSGPGKPVTRGEVGIGDERDYRGDHDHDQSRDTKGVWLHHFVWGQINAGGLYELYWDPYNIHRHNLYYHFKTFRDFMDGIPLNNGRYTDARALTSHPDLRALGQVDRVARRGHLWLHHRQHTWRNIIDNVVLTPISGSVTIPDVADGVYRVTWWDTWQGAPILTQTVAASGGNLVIPLPRPLESDIALKFESVDSRVHTVALPIITR